MSMSKRSEPEKTHMPQRQQHPSFMRIDKQERQQQPKDQSFQAQDVCKQQKMGSFPVPDEIALRIASLLEVWDLCALACCCRCWKELCGSDCLWESLAKKRWASLEFSDESESESSSSTAIRRPKDKGWRPFYGEVHDHKAASAALVIDYVEKCSIYGSLEVAQYQRAIEDLHVMRFGYEDVVLLLLKPSLSVQINLLGLHYCMNWLKVPVKCVVKELRIRKLAERRVCVKWWTLGKWSNGYGIRMNDELHSHQFTLLDVALARAEEVLAVLYRGAIHEVLRVQITVAKPSSTPSSSLRIF
ncbi:putative F-box domain-containing protein [Rosa chinensis]|uniref:Putative F-box domain-containing protein n=1 Tax=Rosa chinensis TaxID=74649 RepID=A0A2P6PZ41_ROSCH|nr:uncharacterized protein LOC112173909 [Rosa chinensis]PRQ27205.1 putative F-box domain-containing protein [Rosa chinensis]